MTNDEFAQLIKYHESDLIKSTVASDRCAVNRIPSAFSRTIYDIMRVLARKISAFCDPATQYVIVFNLQPASMLPPSLEGQKSHYWCTLEMDICSKINNRILKTDAMFINFSDGNIINGAGFLSLFGMQPTGAAPELLGNIHPEFIYASWSELRRKFIVQQLNRAAAVVGEQLTANDAEVARTYHNPYDFSYGNPYELVVDASVNYAIHANLAALTRAKMLLFHAQPQASMGVNSATKPLLAPLSRPPI